MSRPMAADGTISVSTGRPGREKAAAVGEPPDTAINPDSSRATSPEVISLREKLLTNLISVAHPLLETPQEAVFDWNLRFRQHQMCSRESDAAALHLPQDAIAGFHATEVLNAAPEP
jgi:hypothetical protein